MRDRNEIVRAHDILIAVILGEVQLDPPLAPETLRAIHATCDALCWVLEHDHDDTFATNLQVLEQAIADSGYVLEKKP